MYLLLQLDDEPAFAFNFYKFAFKYEYMNIVVSIIQQNLHEKGYS